MRARTVTSLNDGRFRYFFIFYFYFIPPLQDGPKRRPHRYRRRRTYALNPELNPSRRPGSRLALALFDPHHSFSLCSPSFVVSHPSGRVPFAHFRPHGPMPRPPVPSRSSRTWSRKPSHAWKRRPSTKSSSSLLVRDLSPNPHLPELPTIHSDSKNMVE